MPAAEIPPIPARRSEPEGQLARLGFTDAARADRELTALGLWPAPPGDAAAADVVAAIGASARPELVLTGLRRLYEGLVDRGPLLTALRDAPATRERVVGVLACSSALGEHLARHPEDWLVLADDRLASSRPSAFGLRLAMLAAVGADTTEPMPWGSGGARASGTDEAVLDALRAEYRSALLGLAARDVAADLDVADVAGELSDLAAATLDAALAVAMAGLPDDATPCRLAVIGMGKCGGRELNYVSDVDVVFVAEPLGDVDEGAALRTATRLAEGVIRACGTTTSEGAIWPVDAALRPEGKAGPLVRTLASHEAYYRRWARPWEFQALLKARPVAGDIALGNEYLARIAPLVWSAGREELVSEVQALKRRVEESLSAAESGRQLKLGPGGLRDVEFAVQLLQLVHGRTDETLRVGGTLDGLAAIAAGGYVGMQDAERLSAAYRFLRKVEHRLQLQRLRRTHLLPADDDGLDWLARTLGLRDRGAESAVEQFRAEHARHAVEVRRLHEKLFYRPLLGTVARMPTDALRLAPEAAVERLEFLGFADPEGALRHLEALTRGLSRRAVVLRTMLPVMLPWFADAHDPDSGLLAFRSVAEALGESPWFLALLRDSDVVADRLATLLSTSRYVAELLQRAPEAVALMARDDELDARPADALRTELTAVVRRYDDAENAIVAARGLRRHELLRVACADLLGRLDVVEVGRALTSAGEATLAAALDVAERAVAERRDEPLGVRIAIVAMGRLGGWEQGYGSDADVLFVHDPLPDVSQSDASAQAQDVAEELRRLLALPAPDPPLLVDAGLRPEGRQGQLARSLAAYERYYEQWSDVWEAQALLRARPVAGDLELGERFLELVAPVRWPETFTADQVREVRRIKARVETERLPRGADKTLNTKLGPGGLADVEWTVQLLQLQHAHAVPSLRTPSTLDALAAAAAAGLLAGDDAQVLSDAWRWAADARNAVMLVRGRASDALPSDARTLAGVSRALGYPARSRGDFIESYRRATRRARAVVERVFYA